MSVLLRARVRHAVPDVGQRVAGLYRILRCHRAVVDPARVVQTGSVAQPAPLP